MNVTTDRFRAILRQLLARSRKNEVHWEATEKEHNAVFYVTIPDAQATIVVACYFPDAAPDRATAELMVDGSKVADLFAEDGGNAEDYELLKDLWQDAHRCVYGWDQALDKLESVLQSEGTVGAPF